MLVFLHWVLNTYSYRMIVNLLHALIAGVCNTIGVPEQTEDENTDNYLGLKKEVSALKTTVQQLTEEIKELQSRLKSHDEQFRGCT